MNESPKFQMLDIEEVQRYCRLHALTDYPLFHELLTNMMAHLDYNNPEFAVLAQDGLLEILAPSVWDRFRTLTISTWTSPNEIEKQKGLLTILRRSSVLTLLRATFENVVEAKQDRLNRGEPHTSVFSRQGLVRVDTVEDFTYGRAGGRYGFRPAPPRAHGLLYLSAGGTFDIIGNSVTRTLEPVAEQCQWELRLANQVDKLFNGIKFMPNR